jgi:GTPase
MAKRIPIVAVVGRTNVGKSTLCNAIIGKKANIVEDVPGVTRDRMYSLITRYEHVFYLVDTGGIAGDEDTVLADLVREQSERAIAESNLVICVFDALSGVHPQDKEVVDIVRKYEKPVLWVVNKCEKEVAKLAANEFFKLGVDSVIPISAVHSQGIKDLVGGILNIILPENAELKQEDNEETTTNSHIKEEKKRAQKKHDGNNLDVDDTADEEILEPSIIRVALLGRPNVGKSSLFNRILGEQRVVTSSIPGTTRDSIDERITRDGQGYIFVDTAGLRKKSKVDDETVERYSNIRALNTLSQCDVAVLVLDATLGAPSTQDLKIGSLIHERGCGFVIAVNKWDAVEKDHTSVKYFTDLVRNEFKFAKYAPILFLSAETGRRCPSLLKKVKDVCESLSTRIKTSEVNRILRRAFEAKPPPSNRGRPVKLSFASQIGITPPTFVLVCNSIAHINYGYERYIKNVIREQYSFEGVDIKLQFKKKNQEK